MDAPSTPAPLSTAAPALRRWVFGSIFVLTVGGFVGMAFSPYLLVEYPLLLVILAPGPGVMVMTAGSTPFVPFLVVGVVRRVLGMIAFYGLGYLYGPAAARWLERKVRWLAPVLQAVETRLARWGAWLVLVLPLITVVVLAGAARTRLRGVVLASTLGQTVVVAVTYWAGDAVAAWTDRVLVWLADHVVEATVATVIAVVITRWVQRRRGEGTLPDVDPAPPASDVAPP